MDESLNQQPTEPKSGGFSDLKAIGLFVYDFLKVIVVALIIILPIRYFIFQPFIVSGSSMEPNFSNGQYLIIDEISYRTREPVRGEVVVLRYPNDPKQYFIKRIIGLPEERLQIDNGVVTVFNKEYPEGTSLQETYLPNQGLTFPQATALIGGKKTLTLGPDEYFVMGDNRLASSDSRSWGPVESQEIIGRAILRALPLSKFDTFETPIYIYN